MTYCFVWYANVIRPHSYVIDVNKDEESLWEYSINGDPYYLNEFLMYIKLSGYSNILK